MGRRWHMCFFKREYCILKHSFHACPSFFDRLSPEIPFDIWPFFCSKIEHSQTVKCQWGSRRETNQMMDKHANCVQNTLFLTFEETCMSPSPHLWWCLLVFMNSVWYITSQITHQKPLRYMMKFKPQFKQNECKRKMIFIYPVWRPFEDFIIANLWKKGQHSAFEECIGADYKCFFEMWSQRVQF